MISKLTLCFFPTIDQCKLRLKFLFLLPVPELQFSRIFFATTISTSIWFALFSIALVCPQDMGELDELTVSAWRKRTYMVFQGDLLVLHCWLPDLQSYSWYQRLCLKVKNLYWRWTAERSTVLELMPWWRLYRHDWQETSNLTSAFWTKYTFEIWTEKNHRTGRRPWPAPRKTWPKLWWRPSPLQQFCCCCGQSWQPIFRSIIG